MAAARAYVNVVCGFALCACSGGGSAASSEPAAAAAPSTSEPPAVMQTTQTAPPAPSQTASAPQRMAPPPTAAGGSGGVPAAGAAGKPEPSQPAAAGAAGSSTAGASGGTGAAGASAPQPDAAGELTLLEHAWFSGPELGYDTQFMDRAFDLGTGPFTEATLTFQLESPCFPFDKWADSPPPSGQMFPAQCDRFDRLMYFEVDPALQPDATPGLQVLRAITPYGGPMEKTVDITDFANTHPGPHSLRSFVGTWVDDQGQISGSDGGYFLSVRLQVKLGAAKERALAVTPLYSGWFSLQTMLGDLSFTLPEGTTRAQLVYLVTGHGGAMDPSRACIGAAEEFCQRTHHVSVDGTELTPTGYAGPAFVPWRDDCGELCTLAQGHPMMGAYCKENPNRAEGSVTAPRANWCPGDAVRAIELPLTAAQAAPGKHSAHFAIDEMYPEGRWQVALAVYAHGP